MAQAETWRADFEAGLADMRAQFAEIRAEMRKDTNLLINWGIGLSVAVVCAIVGLVTYFKLLPPQVAPRPASLIIVITLPGANPKKVEAAGPSTRPGRHSLAVRQIRRRKPPLPCLPLRKRLSPSVVWPHNRTSQAITRRCSSGETMEMADAQVRPRDLFVILVFCLVLSGAASWGLAHVLQGEQAKFYAWVFVHCASYTAAFLLCMYHFGITRHQLRAICGRPAPLSVVFAAGLGATLLAFQLGGNALEVWLLSQFDHEFAYRHWPFHRDVAPAWQSFDWDSVLYLVAVTVFGPAVEEFLFRGLLLPAWSVRKGFKKAAIYSSLVFTALHIMHPHVLCTLVFSMALCYLYAATNSLTLCIITHGTYNLIVFFCENFFRDWLSRTQDNLVHASDWTLLFALLAGSIVVLAGVGYVGRKRLRPRVIDGGALAG